MQPWLQTSLTVGGIVLGSLVALLLARSAIGISAREFLERRSKAEGETPLAAAELERRVRTLQRIASRIAAALILVIGGLMVMDQVSVDIGPVVAGLGVVGIAVGFGAQTLVRDWLAGVFIILENQFSQGDIVRIAGVDGMVEDFSLRRTTLRDLDGTVHTIPNGQILVASNLTRGWARVNLDVSVAYDADLDQVTELIDRIGAELKDDPEWGPRLLEAPRVLRLNSFSESSIELKVLGQVRPAEQWGVAGELRRRLLAAFSREGVEIPFPHRVMISRPATASAGEATDGEG